LKKNNILNIRFGVYDLTKGRYIEKLNSFFVFTNNFELKNEINELNEIKK
jgi:hypothetical protein